MNLDLWPTVLSVVGAGALTYGTRRFFGRYGGSPHLALLALGGLVLTVTAWMWWPDPHRTGFLDFIPVTVHDLVHYLVVGGAGWAGWRAAEW